MRHIPSSLTLSLCVVIAGSALSACGGAPSALPGAAATSALVLRPAATGIIVSPAALNFTTKPKLTLKVSEKGFTGKFKLAISPAGIAKLSATSAKGPGPAKISVTAVSAGKATIAVSDTGGHKKSVPVTVTQGVIIIQ